MAYSIHDDTTNDIELATFKEKIRQLYNDILHKVYKRQNPGATPEECAAYIEENGLQFPNETPDTEELDGEIEELMNMLDTMGPSDEEESVVDMQMENKPKEYTGEQLKSKSHEKGIKEEMKDIDYKMGGLFKNVKEERKRTATKAPKIPTGKSIERNTADAHKVEFSPLVEKFKEELEELKYRQAIGKRRQLFR
jgi:hypothetical protein